MTAKIELDEKTVCYAFPSHALDTPLDQASDPKTKGMTLLDYFAGQALGVILHRKDCEFNFQELVVDEAYSIAQMMVKKKQEIENGLENKT